MIHFGTFLHRNGARVDPCKIMSFDFHFFFGYTTFVRSRFAHEKLFVPLFTFINNINGDIYMLHGLELLVPSTGTGTGECEIRRKLTE